MLGAARARIPMSSGHRICRQPEVSESVLRLAHLFGKGEAGRGVSPERSGTQFALGRGEDAAAVSFTGKPKHGEVGGRADQGLDVPFRRAASKCSQVGTVEKPSLDTDESIGADPLREFAGEVLRQRVRQPGTPASDLLADSGRVLAVSPGERDCDLVSGQERSAEVMVLPVRPHV